MEKRRWLSLYTLVIICAFLLWSCSTDAPQKSTIVPTPPATRKPTETQEATQISAVKEIDAGDTWLVPATFIDQTGLASPIYGVRWLNERYLGFVGNPDDYWFDTENEEYVDGDALGLAFPPYPPIRPPLAYDLRCSRDGLELYRSEDLTTIATMTVEIEDCEVGQRPKTRISQSKDAFALSFVIDGNVYVWETDSPTPRIVGTTTFSWSAADWSPDGTRLVVREASASGSLDDHTFNILYRDGRPMLITGAVIGTRTEGSPSWFTDDIIVDGVQCGNGCNFAGYYAAATGEYLTGHLYEFNYRFDQGVVKSPDDRWMFIDQTLLDLSNSNSFKYVLFNLAKRTESEFPINQLLDFLWWDEDSTAFTFLLQPYIDDPEYEDGTYGLMPYSLESDETSFLLPNVVHIAPAEEQGMYLATLLDGTLANLQGLNIALFDENHQRISEEMFYAGQMVFSDSYRGLIRPGVWADDGSKAIFTNERGEFWLLNDKGDAIQLSEGNEIEEWPYGIQVNWSLEGTQALISYNDLTWLVKIPEN